MKKNLYILLFLICTISCTNEKDGGSFLTSTYDHTTLSVVNDADYSPHTINEALPGNYDKYMEYFEGTDYEIGVSSHKDGTWNNGKTISCISGISEVQSAQTKSSNKELPQIVSYVNGIKIAEETLMYESTKGESQGISSVFGTTAQFRIGNNVLTKATCSVEESVELYIPAEIEVLSPAATSVSDVNPLCYYKNFILKWNQDSNNKNGVLVLVEWYGGMILGSDIPNTYVRRVASFPDTGDAVLPIEMFDGIPDTAYCNLTILRGNIENVSDGQYTYKVIGETHHLISFILIREIIKNNH